VPTLPDPDALRAGRLTHLDPYRYPFAVVDPALDDLASWFVTEKTPSCYRYVLAHSEGHRRVVGLVTAWVGAPGPGMLLLEALSVEEVAADQGRPLGNARDTAGVLHRLEAYDGVARVALMLDLVRSSLEAASFVPLPWSQDTPRAAHPIWIVTGAAWRRADLDPSSGAPALEPAPWMLHRIDPAND